jgi:hypothetical protein
MELFRRRSYLNRAGIEDMMIDAACCGLVMAAWMTVQSCISILVILRLFTRDLALPIKTQTSYSSSPLCFRSLSRPETRISLIWSLNEESSSTTQVSLLDRSFYTTIHLCSSKHMSLLLVPSSLIFNRQFLELAAHASLALCSGWILLTGCLDTIGKRYGERLCNECSRLRFI